MEQSAGTAAERSHYVWESPAHDIAILLNLNVVDRLQRLLREAPDREIGGLLLGNCDDPRGAPGRRVVVVDDFEPVESQHARGPAYALTSNDLKNLLRHFSRASAQRDKIPVGIFRSHLRKGLYLDEADFSLFQSHFSGPCDVFLVARPEASGIPVAGFFCWEEEQILNRRNSYSTFPLDRASLTSGGRTLVSARSAMMAPVKELAPLPTRKARAVIIRTNRMAKKWAYGSAGVLTILSALLIAMMMHSGTGAAEKPRDVALTVLRDGTALRLNWDAEAPSVAHANSGILWISDGGKQRRMDLDLKRLKQGSIVYAPQSNDVNFRLDLLAVANQGSESVHYIGDKVREPAVAAPVAVKPLAVRTKVKKPVSDDDEDDDRGADRAVPRTQLPADIKTQLQPVASVVPPPVAEKPMPVPTPPVQQPLPQAEPVHFARPRPEPTVSITTEAIPPQRLRDRLRPDWLRKVPLAGMLHLSRDKDGERFVPPRPSHRIMPHVPPRLARDMPAETRLDFKVSIDRHGNVGDIILLSPGDPRLADLSAAALSHWQFDPAELKDKRVESEVVLTMHFHNPPDNAMASK